MNLIENLHILIQQRNLEEVKHFLINLEHDKHCYNTQHVSAAATALKFKQLEIYKFLLSEGVTLGLEEDIEEIVKLYPIEAKRKVREIHKQNAKKSSVLHLMFLYKRSKLTHDVAEATRHEYFKVIENAFEKLNDILWIKPMLKVVACSNDLNIIFDFNQNSIERVDPASDKQVFETSYTGRGDIYVGAKGLLSKDNYPKVLGVMAHELCRYALKLMYNNFGDPFCADDLKKASQFEDILNLTELEKSAEQNVDQVYANLNYMRARELIVQVPQLLAFYSDDLKKHKEFQKMFAELFEFYKEITLVDLKQQLPLMKARNAINELSTISNALKTSMPIISSQTDPGFKLSSSDKIKILSSNHPQVTMNTIYHAFKDNSDFDLCYSFVKLDDVKNDDTLELILVAHSLLVKPKLIIDCEESEPEEIIQMLNKLINNGLKERIFLVTDDNFTFNKCFNEISQYIETLTISYSMEQLSNEYLAEHRKRSQRFQSMKQKFYEALKSHAMERKELLLRVLHFLVLLYIMNKVRKDYNERLIAAETIPPVDQDVYIERSFLSKSDELSSSGNYDTHKTIDDVLKAMIQENVLVIGDLPGIGKSVELRMMAKRISYLLPTHWMAYVNLNDVEDVLKEENPEENNINLLLSDPVKIAEFIATKIWGLGKFETKAFVYSFKNDQVVFFMDNFVELSSTSGQKIIQLFQTIIMGTNNRLHVAGFKNKNSYEYLDFKLFKLTPFTDANRKDFLEKYFRKKSVNEKVLRVKILKIEEILEHRREAATNPLMLLMAISYMS